MSQTSRTLGFTNSLQRLVWQTESGPDIPIVVQLYGGGGGGGGNDSGTGGQGGGGGYTSVSFLINNGDVIDIAVGGAGGGGASGAKGSGGGSAGASYVSGGTSYSGGRGGNAGPAGTSGGGGGGGGATVVLRNGHVMGVAGGGGGGGGAGNRGTRNGTNAPGSAGQASAGQAGQNGQDKSADGGGGGGGGGNSGNGGEVAVGDQGADGGAFGLSSNANPVGRSPGGSPPGQAGIGGGTAQPGNAGAARISFDIPGVFAHDGTSFKPVQRQWVNVNGVWREINEVYVKNGGSWNLVAGSLPAVFNKVGGSFGVDSRPKSPEPVLSPDNPTSEGSSSYEWGGSVGGSSLVRDGSNNPVQAGSGGFVTSNTIDPGGGSWQDRA